MKVRFPTKLVMKTVSNATTLTSKDLKNMSSDAIDDIITKAETKKTKESTKWAIRVFEGEFFILEI